MAKESHLSQVVKNILPKAFKCSPGAVEGNISHLICYRCGDVYFKIFKFDTRTYIMSLLCWYIEKKRYNDLHILNVLKCYSHMEKKWVTFASFSKR